MAAGQTNGKLTPERVIVSLAVGLMLAGMTAILNVMIEHDRTLIEISTRLASLENACGYWHRSAPDTGPPGGQ